jgi:hypothetical protein
MPSQREKKNRYCEKNKFPVRDRRNKFDWARLLTALGDNVKQL